MSKPIRLHKEYGLNPTIPICFYCRKEKNEVALLGAKYVTEAPRHMIIDKQPCDWCRDNMQKGIVFIEVTGTQDSPQPTGCYAVVKEEAAQCLFPEHLWYRIKDQRLCFIEPTLWDQFGLRGVVVGE